jgi:hypothetical protein
MHLLQDQGLCFTLCFKHCYADSGMSHGFEVSCATSPGCAHYRQQCTHFVCQVNAPGASLYLVVLPVPLVRVKMDCNQAGIFSLTFSLCMLSLSAFGRVLCSFASSFSVFCAVHFCRAVPCCVADVKCSIQDSCPLVNKDAKMHGTSCRCWHSTSCMSSKVPCGRAWTRPCRSVSAHCSVHFFPP